MLLGVVAVILLAAPAWAEAQVPAGDWTQWRDLIVVEFAGTRQVITFTENMLVGVSAATGELLWSRPRCGRSTRLEPS